jgi:flagellar motor component MotA
MNKNKLIGLALAVLAVLTVIGMALNNNDYWAVYNYITLIVCVWGSVVLLKQK